MNESQFLELINQYQDIIHKICRLYRNTPEDREDLFQEIVFQLWKSVPAFEGRSKISTWIYRVALNTAMATFRKQKPDISYTGTLPDKAAEPENEAEAFRREQLFEVLGRLSNAEKAIITLYFEDLSYQEISEITGITENYVGVKLNRIKTKIQKLLKK